MSHSFAINIVLLVSKPQKQMQKRPEISHFLKMVFCAVFQSNVAVPNLPLSMSPDGLIIMMMVMVQEVTGAVCPLTSSDIGKS